MCDPMDPIYFCLNLCGIAQKPPNTPKTVEVKTATTPPAAASSQFSMPAITRVS